MKINSFLMIITTILSNTGYCQNYISGSSYFSENDYVEYIHGNLPIILSAPHGGEKRPDLIPDRDCTGCVYVNDAYTQELIREVAENIHEKTGCYPYSIISRLHRSKLDANRAIIEAADGNVLAENAWTFYHAHVDSATAFVEQAYGKGIFIDLHGHGHDIQRLELGYLLTKSDLQEEEGSLNNIDFVEKSSIRKLVSSNLQGLDHEELIRGEYSLGSLMEIKNYAAVPSENDHYPANGDPYFSGGYNTRQYGSRQGGTIDAIQVECNQDVRFVESTRKRFADSLASAILDFLELHYFDDFNEENCSLSPVIDFQSSVKIYPNPTSSVLNIELDQQGVDCRVINQFGQAIRQLKLQAGINSIELSGLPAGFYQIQLQFQHTHSSTKLLLLPIK